MAAPKISPHNVQSCNLGKFGADGIALKVNFVMSTGEPGKGEAKSAVFGLSREVARGLAAALTSLLEETKGPTSH
jgi:hypothetical protein